MPRRLAEEDEWDDDDAERGENEDGVDDSPDEDDEPMMACPHCKKQIHEDSQRCPFCEQYISREDAPPARKPWWIIIGVLVCLYVVYRWIVG